MALRSQRNQAIQQAALAVVEGGRCDASLTDTAERFIKSADPHTVTDQRGNRFEWSFSYDDVPEIVAAAEKILEGPADRHKENPLSLRLGPLREATEKRADELGVPVRRFIIEAITEKLERNE
jgi:hypothetical protein